MNVTASTILSGMNAAQTRMQVAAHNIANMNTQNFAPQEVAQSSAPGGGVTTSVSTSPNATGSNLETDMVQQLMAKHSFMANVAVFKSHNEMLGSLLDIRA